MKKFLKEKEREYPKSSHLQEKNSRTRDKIKAILMANTGWTYKETGEALLLDHEISSRHVREYKEYNKLSVVNTGGSNPKLSFAQSKELINQLEKSTYLKVSDICIYIREKYAIIYTIGGVTNCLKSNDFSYKKPKSMPSNANPKEQDKFIHEYRLILQKSSINKPPLFMDAVHSTMESKITYGWIRTGQNKPIATTAARPRINLLGTINLKTMRVELKSYTTINQESVSDYFFILKKAYPKAEYSKIHIIVNCGSYNTSKKTQEEVRKQGIILHYLPPYSPNLNAIERLWKVMNEYSKNNQFFKTAKEFRDKIKSFFDITWPLISESTRSRINDNFEHISSIV